MLGGIIRTSNLIDVVPAMFEHPGTRPKLNGSFDMFILSRKKRCVSCGENKSLKEFYKQSDKKDGHSSRCISCSKSYLKDYYKNNRDEMIDYAKNWQSEHPDRASEHKKKWFSNNHEKGRLYRQNRRAKIKNNGGTITAQEWQSVLDMYGNRCLYPGCDRTDLEMDHVKPIELGGTNTVDNIQPLCVHHNRSKGTKWIDYR